jgi:hypothetical protein
VGSCLLARPLEQAANTQDVQTYTHLDLALLPALPLSHRETSCALKGQSRDFLGPISHDFLGIGKTRTFKNF